MYSCIDIAQGTEMPAREGTLELKSSPLLTCQACSTVFTLKGVDFSFAFAQRQHL